MKGKLKGSELIFISRIRRDGMSLEICNKDDMNYVNDEIFELRILSLSKGTYIASNFNSYIVKLKNQ